MGSNHKFFKKRLTNAPKCAAAFATDLFYEVAKAALGLNHIFQSKEVPLMSHETMKALFSQAVNQVASDISLYAVNPGKDFTRTKKLDPATLFSFLVSCGSSSTRAELLDFFGLSTNTPSASAFNQQRAKLKPEALCPVFRELFPLPFPCGRWLNVYFFQQAFLLLPGIFRFRRAFCKRLLQHAPECVL